jgi:hypothetical protein
VAYFKNHAQGRPAFCRQLKEPKNLSSGARVPKKIEVQLPQEQSQTNSTRRQKPGLGLARDCPISKKLAATQ